MHIPNDKKLIYADSEIRIIRDLKPDRDNDIIVESFAGKDNLDGEIWYEVCVPQHGDSFFKAFRRVVDAFVKVAEKQDNEPKESAAYHLPKNLKESVL